MWTFFFVLLLLATYQVLSTNVDQTISTESKQPAEIKNIYETGQTSVDVEKPPPPNDFPKVNLDDDDEEYLSANGERIPARTYLDKIRAQGKSSAEGTTVLEDTLSLLLTNYLTKNGSWSPLSNIELDQRLMLIKEHPLFKVAAKLEPQKVEFQVNPRGGSNKRDLLRLDPLTGIVYRTCTISIIDNSEGGSSGMIQDAKFLLALTTKIEENYDGSVNVWVKLASTEPFIPFQQRIRLATENKFTKISDLKGKNVPNIRGEIFAQPFQPGHYLVPVLARHDLPESSPDNFNIYIAIEEHTQTNYKYKDEPRENNPLSQSTICVWLINGGPGGKSSDLRSAAQNEVQWSFLRTPSGIVKVRAILVEHRGIGQSHRLAPSRRLEPQNEKDPWSTAMIDLPIDQYGSTAAASDLISIVKSYEKMHKDERIVHLAYGVSYGTRLISNAIRMAPTLFHTVFLASMDGLEVKESNIDTYGPVVVMKNHSLYSGHQENLSSRLLEAFDGLKDDRQLNPCKVFLKQHPLFSNRPNLLEGFLHLANSSKRLDVILFLLLQVHECKNMEGTEKWLYLICLIEKDREQRTFETASSESLYTYTGSNVSGIFLFQLVEWLERFQMNPTEYYQKYCEGQTVPVERFINHFHCMDAHAFSEAFLRLEKEHPQLADQVRHTKPFSVSDADLDAIDQSLPRTHVIIMHGALDKTTELGPARKSAVELASRSFKVDMIVKLIAGHSNFIDEVESCLEGFYSGIDFGAKYKKINNHPSSHNEWISKAENASSFALKVVARF